MPECGETGCCPHEYNCPGPDVQRRWAEARVRRACQPSDPCPFPRMSLYRKAPR